MKVKEFVKFICDSMESSPDSWQIMSYVNSKNRILLHTGGIVVEIDRDVDLALIGNGAINQLNQLQGNNKDMSVRRSVALKLTYWQRRKIINARNSLLREKAARMIDRAMMETEPLK